ncbi:MAG: hypothetical protein ACLQPD_14135 [Desulfomonilaceae bacterium]
MTAKKLLNEELIRKAIEKVLSSRQRPGYWADSGKEDPQETMVYKGLEALNTILYIRNTIPTLLGRFKFDGRFVAEEVLYLYNSFKKEGFFPSPYSHTRELFDCLDFASLCVQVLLEILLLVRKKVFTLLKIEKQSLQDQCHEIINAALSLIEKSVFTDKNGARWEGTYGPDRERPLHANVYFTSSAIKALHAALNSPDIHLDPEKRDLYLILQQQGIFWILDREKDGMLAADEARTKTEINHVVYALLALIQSWTALDSDQREKAKKLFSNLGPYLENNKDQLQSQTLMEIVLPGTKKPVYYEYRFDNGVILSTLCRGREAMKDALFNDEDLTRIINTFARGIIEASNSDEGYWPKEQYLVHVTYDCIIALIDFELYGTPLVYTFSDHEILRALNNTLKRSEIRNIFLSELAKVLSKKHIDEFRRGEE